MERFLLLAFDEAACRPWKRIFCANGTVDAITHYSLSPDQPVPVMLGKRPGSPYARLTTLEFEAEDPSGIFDMFVSMARNGAAEGHEPFAYWLYRPLTDVVHREDAPTGGHHIHLAFTNPIEGREEDYNRWYSGEHMAHALLADGFVTGQRFRLERVGGDGADLSPYEYLTLYGLRTDDVRASENDMHKYATGEKPGMPLSDALGPVRATWVYSPVRDAE